jgi:chromosomal replication initiation ATPase DnaA
MSDNKELSELLKNIQDGLKTYGLKELNSSLETFLKKNENDDSKTELILKLVCIEYNINKKVLLHSTERGEIQEARRMAICLLFFNTNISIRKIAKMVFNRDYHLFIQKAIKRHRSININVKPDRLYKEKYDKLEQIIKTK